MTRLSEWLNHNSLYIALLAAWIAMTGSLYFSEVMGYIPCTLCWHQRILMYPLTAVIAVGLLRRDWHLPYYVLPLSVFGLAMSTYHYLLEKTDLFDAMAACRQGVSCTTQWINWFGFVTIPFLALVAFLVITIMSVIALVNAQPAVEDEEGEPIHTPWLKVGGTITAVLAVAAVFWITGTPQPKVAADTATFPLANVTPGPQMTAHNHDPAMVARGEQLYLQACAACHGVDARGVVNLGNTLVDSEFVAGVTDAELLTMIRAGRDLADPANMTGLVMPPSGGRPDLSDEDMLAMIAFIRSK